MAISSHLEGMFGEPAEQDPYLPFPAALRARIILSPQDLAAPLGTSPGASLAQRQIPNYRGAGIIEIPSGFAAFDLTAGEIHGRFVDIYPATKSAVSHGGEILAEGLVPFETTDGRLKIAARAINAAKRPWLIDDFASKIPVHQLMSEVIVVPYPVLDSPEYEMHDVDDKTGRLRFKERAHYL